MIFNPYELPDIASSITTAFELPWAQPLLADSKLMIGLVLAFLMADVLACCPKGVMRHQLLWLTDTRNARTFESSVVILPWLKPVMLLQCFLFFGLTAFCLIAPDAYAALSHPTLQDTLPVLLPVMLSLSAWYLLQRWLIGWLCYLFRLSQKNTILNRTYDAAFVLLAPLVTICYVALTAGLISSDWAFKLLAALFISSQISFIFNGIKIFYDGFYSLLLIIVYLCTLEIAPILMIWARLTPN